MSRQLSDHPNVAVFPPAIPLATLAIACGLQWLFPLGLLSGIGIAWRIGVGAVATIVGVLITVNGRLALTSRGTNVNPFRPVTALVTTGIYLWTRNPMYVGIAPVMCGIAFMFALDWLLLLVVPSYLILHFCVIEREEQYLERKFGDEYSRYRARAPRYVRLIPTRSSSRANSNRHQQI